MTLETPPPAPDVITVLTRVEWVDTDAAGHHHNSSIMRWVETAEAEMMRAAGLPEYFPCAPRVHQRIDFRSKLVFEQSVRTRLWIERLGTTSLSFGFDVAGAPLTQAKDWVTAAAGTLVTAHVPLGADGSAPWPPAWRAALSPYCLDATGKTSIPATTQSHL